MLVRKCLDSGEILQAAVWCETPEPERGRFRLNTFSENIYINKTLMNKLDFSDMDADSPPAPQKKTMSHESCHKFSKLLLTSYIILLLILKILFSIALITLFKKHPPLLDEKAIMKELNYTDLECTKQHSPSKDKVWSCCPKDWKPFSSHCYFTSNDSASWRESEEKCSSMGAHLMVIHSQEEQDFITNILDPNAVYYIGLSDRGHRQWQWVDQTPYNESATFWHPGQPNNKNDNEECVVNHSSSRWGWNDIPCSCMRKSVCQMKKIYL
ncbi:C-type lectin domain family 4 member A-like [Peromyscus californicus insignis]|uniref:C-type lectin domain family 4 member A-like n=1 Tax=Peromyscus californicus insignis TaxID=564181 RepID=UPI0022A75804|nr:C-type lectin domain family 4 member A-like [Peromyscus californicus insignis]